MLRDHAVRHMPLQLAMAIAVCGLCILAGQWVLAASIAVFVAVTEATMTLILAGKRPFNRLSDDAVSVLAWTICIMNTAAYLAPTFALAALPSVAMKVTAVLWIVGVQVYLINSWSRLPPYLYAMVGISMVMLGLVFWQLPATAPAPSSGLDWAIATIFLAVFVGTTFETLRKSQSIESALERVTSESAKRLRQLEMAQRVDGLTHVLNRNSFDAALTDMLSDSAPERGTLAVFMLDLDYFKPINETFGLAAGDYVLQQVARRIETFVGDRGIVGRLGGDEFIFAIQIPPGTAKAEALAIQQAIATPIDWTKRPLNCNASIGYVVTGVLPHDTRSALCGAADRAMYLAKNEPSRKPVAYDPNVFSPRLSAEDRRALRDAIKSRELRPFYQPKVHLPTGQIIGFEALSRWVRPGLPPQPPSLFIQELNDLGLQGDFMSALARQVFEDIGAMLDAGLDPGQVSLNLVESALATSAGRRDIEDLLAAHPRIAPHVTFEITEDVFIGRAAKPLEEAITAFRALGTRVSLDDFGTGFASFHHLRQLEFDELKIDRSFVAGLGTDPAAEVLVRGFLDIASGLGVNVVAEGVETQTQARDLINMGCMTAQGYLFSEALPADAALARLRTQQAA